MLNLVLFIGTLSSSLVYSYTYSNAKLNSFHCVCEMGAGAGLNIHILKTFFQRNYLTVSRE